VSGRLAVGVSGTGSNLAALLAAARRGELGGDVVLVFADRPCPAGQLASEAGVETAIAPDDAALAQALEHTKPDLVVLAGFMRLLGRSITDAFAGRIVNIHPSLLPAFPGLHPQRQALECGVRITGATVHFVDEGVDTGPIVLQSAVAVHHDDTEETLSARILAEEHRIYPEAIRLFAEGRLSLKGRRVSIREGA